MMAHASALNDLVICVPRLATLQVVHLTFGEECPKEGPVAGRRERLSDQSV